MAESKLAALSIDFAVNVLRLCDKFEYMFRTFWVVLYIKKTSFV